MAKSYPIPAYSPLGKTDSTQMGLLTALVEQPEVWAAIYASAVAEHQKRLKTKDWAVGTPDGWRNLVRQVVSKALQN